MKYEVTYSKKALEDIDSYNKAGDRASAKKVLQLIDELCEHPYTGTGKPEALTGNYVGFWSRRINQKDRLVYTVKEEIVTVSVVQAKEHYSDK